MDRPEKSCPYAAEVGDTLDEMQQLTRGGGRTLERAHPLFDERWVVAVVFQYGDS